MAVASAAFGAYAAAFAIAITLALVLLGIHRRNFAWAPIYGSLLLLHPAWTMGVQAGDCGASMRFLSIADSLILAVILLCQIFWPNVSKRRFVLSLCVIAWALYLINWPLIVMLPESLASPDASGFGAFVFPFLLTDMLLPALGLTFVCFLIVIVSAIYRKRRLRCADTLERAWTDEMTQSHPRRLRIPLSFLALIPLLILALLQVNSPVPVYRGNPAFSHVAITLAVLLLVSAARGKFPGWR